MTADHDHSPEQLSGVGAQAHPANWVEEAMAEHHARTEPDHAARRPDEESRNREQQVLERIEKARNRKAKIKEERITLAHGAGGKATQTLIEAVFLEHFRNPLLQRLEDGAEFAVGRSRLTVTTDSFVVSPLFFPGGDIGDLAINGTVNDLAVSGARPLYLSAGFIIEEGFPVADLTRIVKSMAAAAQAAGVQVITGDTKVVQRGKADGCYINTTGVGVIDTEHELGIDTVRTGDSVLVSGPLGDHGITVMLARGELDIDADLASDTAPVHGLTADLLHSVPGVRAMRDATRGGVATILNEVATASKVAVVVDEDRLPVRTEVRGASELLGIDPLYVACEGRIVVVVDGEQTEAALAAMRAHPVGSDAAVIGRIGEDPPGLVLLNTAFGGTRIVDLLVGDPLPRIC
ncbi:hydrogenase maturation carbamoyl dehydratase HypE [Halopolyspora algeriensis]|uniref:Hydrogenase maturation carbamoyl dehydratase HypE n=1 Tax=Halopolyspora algeriensis TaxID=1500506 RepID=A0A368VGD7_9ACTN|nr:hydrogenase expression/formation protein HypE [Halopolyspora algeriensis]RCW40388.1 hydrogenase maturation carbamoyl dehydratase HypE [Halopolyspora algeriensis]TQM53672.1 hydrogenase maturation carbamoyl dehydratase HypE [Halopolyspora algeriensis]